jgi:UDP-glucuronate 4-epimerase
MQLVPRRILVTGAAGFIGGHVTEALLRRGDHVVALDNFDSFYDPQIKRNTVAGYAEHPNCRLVEGDIRDAELLDGILSSWPCT